MLKVFEISKYKKILKYCKEYLKSECEHLQVGQIKQSGAENLYTYE